MRPFFCEAKRLSGSERVRAHQAWDRCRENDELTKKALVTQDLWPPY
jgi:hypothetical protein